MANLFQAGHVSRDAAANALGTAVNGGTPPGRIEHRAGAQTTNVNDASPGLLLGTNLFKNPAFLAASVGVITADTPIVSDTSADNSGTALSFRIYTGSGTDTQALSQGDSGTSATDMVFDNNGSVAGGR